MDHKIAISIVQDYALDLKLPRYNQKGARFIQISYSIWAVDEVLKYLNNHQRVPPIMAIEDFISMMNKYSCMNIDTSYKFSVAHDIATDILDIFLAAS